ncbi:MAG: RND family efflux transporter MFP subunit [Rhodospirillaceae bacterium]|nr:MAG: RND family efflux transporter MFP subunit [Rhodospirillaceae bacterium]
MKQALPSSLIAAGVMISIVAVWILSGLFSSNAKPAIAPSDMAAVGTSFAVPRVRTRVITAEERMVHLTVNGRTQAHRTVVVKAETAGQVAEVLVKKGEQVAAGQVMVRLKEEERPARLAEARALVRRRAVEHEAAKALEQKAFASRIRLAEAEASWTLLGRSWSAIRSILIAPPCVRLSPALSKPVRLKWVTSCRSGEPSPRW